MSRLLNLSGIHASTIEDVELLAEMDRQLPDMLRRRFSLTDSAAVVGLSVTYTWNLHHRGDFVQPDGGTRARPFWYYASLIAYNAHRLSSAKPGKRLRRVSDLSPVQRQLMLTMLDTGAMILCQIVNNRPQVYVIDKEELFAIKTTTFRRLLDRGFILLWKQTDLGDLYAPVQVSARERKTLAHKRVIQT